MASAVAQKRGVVVAARFSDTLGLTKTEQRLYHVLRDGKGHTNDELRLCCNDEEIQPSTFRTHMANLRNKLRRSGRDVAVEQRGVVYRYRLIRLPR